MLGHDVRQHLLELLRRRARAGLVELHELIGVETEDLAEIASVAPRIEEVSNAGERVATRLEPTDELKARDMARPVDPDAPATRRRREQSESLVLADRPNRHCD